MPTEERPNSPGSGCLLVLGMHRSGTSAVTSVLARLGLSVGEPSALHPADEGNPSGYWEPAELVRIDDALLASWGGHQRSPQLGARARSLDAVPTPLASRMREWAGRWDPQVPFVWKDPRLCVTLPLWRPLLPIRGLVIAARDPSAVAGSLEARDGMTQEAGLVLWEAYVRSLLANLEDTPRLTIRYEDLLTRTVETVDRLADFAEQTVGVASPDRGAAVSGIEPRRPESPDGSTPSATQKELYDLLCAGTSSPDLLASPEVVSLLDFGATLGADATRRKFILHAAEEKIERLRAKAPPATPGRRGAVARLRSWARRIRSGR